MIRPDGLTHGALAEQLIEAPRTPQRILTEDIDVDTPAPAPHRGRELDIEDALDEVGGLGRYQIGHFLACGIFWFAQSGILVSVFVNTAWEDRYRELNAARWWSECRESLHKACHRVPQLMLAIRPDNILMHRAASVSCQFALSEGNLVELFDSAFFAGWLWSVPVWGWISDKYGRKVCFEPMALRASNLTCLNV